MMPLSPILLATTAAAFVGLGDATLGSAFGDHFRHEVGALDDLPGPVRWDTAFVHHVGYWAHYDQRLDCSSWPLPPSFHCEALAAFAEEAGVLVEEPREGDLLLLWSPVKQTFQRTGIVVWVGEATTLPDGTPARECVTIEGDSEALATGTAGQVLRYLRLLSSARGDRFVRWTALDDRRVA